MLRQRTFELPFRATAVLFPGPADAVASDPMRDDTETSSCFNSINITGSCLGYLHLLLLDVLGRSLGRDCIIVSGNDDGWVFTVVGIKIF